MSASVTFDDVWKMFQESIRQADLRAKEADVRAKEADVRARDLDNRLQELARLNEENRLFVKEVCKRVDDLTGKWGKFVEGIVIPSCDTLFADWGIPVHKVATHVKAKKDDGRNMEIDVLVINTTAAILVEVKSTLTVGDVRHHLKRLGQFKDFFPEYADKRVMGAVASIEPAEHVEQFARNSGLFVMVQASGAVCLANEKGFVPRSW